jgi:thiosulfate/3-mercaptopyruvate sulfurtransferase
LISKQLYGLKMMVNLLKKAALSVQSTLIISTATAQNNDTIIDTMQMQKAMDRGAIIWDVRDEKSYLEGHLPGAINFGDIGAVLKDPNKEDFIATEQIKKIFDAAGLDVRREVMVYGLRGNPNAYFGLYALTTPHSLSKGVL